MAEETCWALVPAAGVGARMGADRPKQYLELIGRTVIEHCLRRLCTHARIRGVLVCISPGDSYWPRVRPLLDKLIGTVDGGTERAHSVLQGLKGLFTYGADGQDWVIVHDAVRPCLRHGDIDVLIDGVAPETVGGLLGAPLSDTIKRTDRLGLVVETVPREGLWRALTPQMFRLGPLLDALEQALRDGVRVTDEASAVEYCGGRPLVVPGHSDNIKITVPEDLILAELYLKRQMEGAP